MVILDFETTYAPRTPPGEQPHGLRHQTTQEYLHDPRTQVLGCAFLFPRIGEPDRRVWIDDVDKLEQVLQGIANSRTAVAAHNAAFDLSVWARFFPASYAVFRQRAEKQLHLIIDTVGLARWASSAALLPPEVGVRLANLGEHYGLYKGDTEDAVAHGNNLGEYALRDVDITLKILRDLFPKWPLLEHRLSTVHVLMSTPGPCSLHVDAEVLSPVAVETEHDKKVATWFRKDENFLRILERFGVRPEYKTTPAGRQKLALAKTDEFMRRLQVHPVEEVRKAAALRLSAGSNINRTRAQRMLVSSGDGARPLPLAIEYFKAHTGRSGGSGGMNPQNMPRGGPHRRALVAPPGHKLVVADASQIEVRVLAALAGDEELLDVFRRGGDPYKAFAMDLYSLSSEDAVTTEQRRVAKSAVLGLGFGAAGQGFLQYCATMGVQITDAEADRVVNVYRHTRRPVVQYWHRLKTEAEQTGQIELPSGRVMVYPGMDGKTFQRPQPFVRGDIRSKYWHGLFTENVVQATARDITLLDHAVKLAEKYPVVLLVHDEVGMCVPEAEAEECLAEALRVMSQAPRWLPNIPLAAEGSIVDNYAEAK